MIEFKNGTWIGRPPQNRIAFIEPGETHLRNMLAAGREDGDSRPVRQSRLRRRDRAKPAGNPRAEFGPIHLQDLFVADFPPPAPIQFADKNSS